jgi:hypothetical protein
VHNLRFVAHDSLHLPQLDLHMNKLQNSVAQSTQHAVFELSDSPESPRTSDLHRHLVGELTLGAPQGSDDGTASIEAPRQGHRVI